MSHYVILQYGNVITGEYSNIAVYAYDDNKPEVYSKFAVNWTQINTQFEIEDPNHKDVIFETILETHLKKIATKEELQECMRVSNSPFSSLLFTEPRASETPVETLLEEMSKRFLTE